MRCALEPCCPIPCWKARQRCVSSAGRVRTDPVQQVIAETIGTLGSTAWHIAGLESPQRLEALQDAHTRLLDQFTTLGNCEPFAVTWADITMTVLRLLIAAHDAARSQHAMAGKPQVRAGLTHTMSVSGEARC
jgi:hypothetical protein